MIQCNRCGKWLHFACAGTDRQPFVCRTCAAPPDEEYGAVRGARPNVTDDTAGADATNTGGNSDESVAAEGNSQDDPANATPNAAEENASSPTPAPSSRTHDGIQVNRHVANLANRSFQMIEQIRAEQRNHENEFRHALIEQQRMHQESLAAMQRSLQAMQLQMDAMATQNRPQPLTPNSGSGTPSPRGHST